VAGLREQGSCRHSDAQGLRIGRGAGNIRKGKELRSIALPRLHPSRRDE